jgi:hypothetical protein
MTLKQKTMLYLMNNIMAKGQKKRKQTDANVKKLEEALK